MKSYTSAQNKTTTNTSSTSASVSNQTISLLSKTKGDNQYTLPLPQSTTTTTNNHFFTEPSKSSSLKPIALPSPTFTTDNNGQLFRIEREHNTFPDQYISSQYNPNTLLSPMIPFSPNISAGYQQQCFTPTFQSALSNYPFTEDIHLSIQQIVNTLNLVITDLFVMLNLLLKKNNQSYFTTCITKFDEEIIARLRKGYDTINQLFLFLNKEKDFIKEIRANLHKLRVVSSSKAINEELELAKEAQAEFIKFDNQYLQYESVLNVYIGKFKLTFEYIKKQVELIDRYNNLNFIGGNTTTTNNNK